MDHDDKPRKPWVITAGTWACAAVVVATEAWNALLVVTGAKGNWLVGAGLGFSVSTALVVGLSSDRVFLDLGATSRWSRPLRVTAALMSLIIGAGSALYDRHFFLALLLSFFPVLLWLLTELGQDVHRVATRQADDTTRRDTELRQLRQERDDTAAELAATRRDIDDKARQADATQRAELTSARQETDRLSRRVAELTTQLATRRDTSRDNRDTDDTPSATPEARRTWVRRRLALGHQVTGAEVHRQFPGAPRDGSRIVRQVIAEQGHRKLTLAGAGR